MLNLLLLSIPVYFLFPLRDYFCYNKEHIPVHMRNRAFEMTANFNQSEETGSSKKEWSTTVMTLELANNVTNTIFVS